MSISNSLNVIPIEYSLQTYHRSNQDTTLLHRPVVKEGDWVQAGDLISDSGASIGGEFSIGQNLLIAYLPWEGYNYEDAILISERLVYDDLYTSIHIERYDISTEKTPYGNEIITKDILLLKDTNELEHLDENGVAQLGSWLKEGDILVGKITPTEPKKEVARYIQLYNDILGKKIDYSFRDTSLRVPRGLEAKVIRVQLFPEKKTRLTKLGLVKKKLSVKLPKVKGYKSKIEPRYLRTHYQGLQIKEKFFVLNSLFFLASLKKRGLSISQRNRFKTAEKKRQRQKKRIKVNYTSFFCLHSLFFLYSRKKQSQRKKDQNKCKTPVFSSSINYKKSPKKSKTTSPLINSVHVYLAEKRKVQVGDKMAGRHGNKGIISQILPRQDMPYLPDGSPIDLALNPLGVPSRMNVGQIYECLLGLAGKNLGEQYRIKPFDESFGSEASRSFVFSKLYEARLKTGQSWLFQPINPGKLKLFDGRTGNRYDQAITAGYSYMIKLVHLVDEKIHSRSSGPYSLITQQPLKGRSKHGGQRLGEMEVWAIEAYGAAFILLELLTIKSDDVTGRLTIWDYILYKKPLYIGTPASFKVLICELQALCLDIGIYKADPSNTLKQIHVSSMG
jgi:DNA-directed RNA polymerase subunit beta